MSARIVIIGGGEHARVIIDAARASAAQPELVGFVDPEPCLETIQRLGLRRLGDEDALETERDLHAVLGFGAVEPRGRREEAVRRVTPLVRGWASVIHGAAWISPGAIIGEGTVIMAGAVIQTGARIGAHCVVNTGAIVEHDVVLGDFVQLAPRAALGGGVRVDAGAYIGMGATVRDHTRVRAGAVVGMGAVVVRDVAAGARVMGVPAR
ncbi:MAG: NeuD/PglB/VioB family sugar acetyltransferase [Gemmatimonadales bacterium]